MSCSATAVVGKKLCSEIKVGIHHVRHLFCWCFIRGYINTFSTVDHSVESLNVHGSAAAIPDGDAPGDHRIICCGVKGPLQHCRDLTFPQPSEVIKVLPPFLHWGGDVGGPCQVSEIWILRYL